MALIDDLVAFWELDEASGDALDSHGSLHLTETGGSIGAAAGVVGGARDFVAADTELFEISDNPDVSFGDEPFTLAFWIRFDSVSGFAGLAGQWNWSGGDNNAYLVWRNNTQLIWSVSHDGTGAGASVEAAVTTAAWYFLVVYHDPVTNQIGISVNAGAPTTTSHSAGVFDSAGPFQVGGSVGAGASYHDGLIDGLGLWRRVLTPDERTELYNGGNGRSYSYLSGGLVVPDHTLHFGQEF